MLRKRVLCAALAVALQVAAPAAAQDVPPAPGVPPPGANDFSCRSAAHPEPVILVHGTFGDMTQTWPIAAPVLERAGYCVFALDLVRRGMAPMDQSADKLAAFIDEVRSKTGAAKVSLVGHSQGGMLPRYVARFRGKHTVVSTTHDEVVTPYQSQALAGPQATNVVLQDRCPADPVEHITIPYDPVALQWTLDALGQPGPANPAFEPDCSGATFGHDPGRAGAVPRTNLNR